MAITLSEIKTQCRERADMTDSEHITDPELTSLINNSVAELHDILIQAYDSEYFIKEATFTTTSDAEQYDLSTVIPDDDFYKLRGMDAQLNGDDFFTLVPFNFNERNRFKNFGAWDYLGITNVRYRILGNKVRFSPKPDREIQVKIWYIPVAAKLVNDSDELQDFNQFSEYVINDVVIKMKNKEESDVTIELAQKAELKRRIEEAANNRDAANPQSVEDIYVQNDDYFYTRTRS